MKLKISLVGALLGVLTPMVVFATSSLELFPTNFESTINLHAGDPSVIIARIINAALLFLGILAVILIIYGGFVWMTAAGNEEKLATAKKILFNAGIGLLLILSSFIIARFIMSSFLGALGEGGGEVIIVPPGCQGPGCINIATSGFSVRGISPKGSVPLRNVVVKIVFNKTPDASTLAKNVSVTKKSDGSLVDGKLEAAGQMIKFTPKANCPAPNEKRKCFDAETDFQVSVSETLKSVDGLALSCAGLSSPCVAEFHTGSLVDTQPPRVVIQSPRQGDNVSVDTCVPMQAKVTDDSGVASVEFFDENKLIDTATPVLQENESSPKEVILEISCWDTTGLGTPATRHLIAKAYDINDNSALSPEVKVTVRPAHCFNEAKDDSEDGVDCSNVKNGVSGCGLCSDKPCTGNDDCASGYCDASSKVCVDYPKIMDISPGDGQVGTFVTISGLNFGSAPGKIFFTPNKEASAPAACDPKTSWTNKQIIVGVPAGAVDGPIKVCNSAGLCDVSNDNNGALVPTHRGSQVAPGEFDVNEVVHPGLCRAFSPTEHTSCAPGLAGDQFCQNDNKDASGNPDKSAFCHPQKNICVFPKGRWNAPVYMEGAQFGAPKGLALFSGIAQTPNNWQAIGQAETVLPPLKYGPIKVQVLAAAGACQNNFCSNNSSQSCATNDECVGLPSNAVAYTVLSPDAGTVPKIISINPNSGGPGTGLTITGENFGEIPGLVWFIAPDGQVVQADLTGLPPECEDNDSWWTPEQITVKAPKVLDINDFNKNGSKSDVLAGAYQIYVRRQDSVESARAGFTMNNTPPGPLLWCLDPTSGPNFTNVTIYGENFGPRPQGQNKPGVYFALLASAPQLPAVLTNQGGTPGGACPGQGWSDKKICVQAPESAISGQVTVKNEVDNVSKSSNGKDFTVGSCQAPATISVGGKAIKNPNSASCGSRQECCADGVCRQAGQCQELNPQSFFGWQFSTTPTEIVPSLVTDCMLNATDTNAQGIQGRFPSPSPSLDWPGGNQVCLNAQISGRFDAAIDPASLNNNIILEKCQSTDANNLLANSGFEISPLAGWQITDSNKLAAAQVQAPQTDLLDDAQEAEGTITALRLEKLQPEPDRGLGDGNAYTQSFAIKLTTGLDAYNKEYKFSAKVRAAQNSDQKENGVGQRAGILLRQVDASGAILDEQTVEIILTQDWQPISLSAKFGPKASSLEVGLFLTSPTKGSQISDYNKYAAYFDNLNLLDSQTLNCQNASPVPGAIIPISNGFSLLPSGDLLSNTWYKVSLKIGIKAVSQGGKTGVNMKEDASLCGQGKAACWLFKTGTSTCLVKRVWVLPNPYTAVQENEKINYSALPGGEDVCLNLNPQGLSWDWFSSDVSKATVENSLPGGRVCLTNDDCQIRLENNPNACLNGHCAAMPWTNTATAKAETEVPVKITAEAQARDTQIKQPGTADLQIHFTDPKVVDFWPACQQACLNAEIGLQFNIPMNETTLTNVNNFTVTENTCGNGQPNPGESCDDGNTTSWDGCSSRCLNEGSYFQRQCGNGRVDQGEDCDDGNTQDDLTCPSNCIFRPNLSSTCGNDQHDPGEECDDGNKINGDGCSDKCLHEGGVKTAICGNEILETGEECEENAQENFMDWCDPATCLRTGTSPAGGCGNGAIDPGEECDPNSKLLLGSPAKQKLCNNKCLWTGTLKPTVAGGAGCGNGKVDLGEDCDDNNTKNGDGCSEICLNEGSQSNPVSVCGNGGSPESGEDCDSTPGCSDQCLNQGTKHAVCGNNVVETGEDCDWKLLSGQGYGDKLAKMLCSSDNCLNQGHLNFSDEDQKLFATLNKNLPICGNGVKEPGESCDPGPAGDWTFCNHNTCLNTGRDANQIELNAPTPFADASGNDIGVSFTPKDLLLPFTSYHAQAQNLQSATGKNLAPFSWNFYTKGEKCSVNSVDVLPAQAVLYMIGAKEPYLTVPRAKLDICSSQGQRLNGSDYDWGWSSQYTEVATVANNPQNLVPPPPPQTAEAIAVGLRTGEKVASVTEITAKITAGGADEDKDKQGAGDLAVMCGYRDDAACVAANSSETLATIGVGNNTCCYNRPTITDFVPKGNDACPNGLLSVTFSTLMDKSTLTPDNFILAREVASNGCSKGEVAVNQTNGEPLDPVPTSGEVWCAGGTKLNLVIQDNNFQTIVDLKPATLLDSPAKYKLIVNQGVKNLLGVAMAGTEVRNFGTAGQICTINKVSIDVQIPSGSAGSGTETEINKPNKERALTAQALAKNDQIIVPVKDVYEWTWAWNSSDAAAVEADKIITFQKDAATGLGQPDKARLVSKNKNGEVVITAGASILDKTSGQSVSSEINGAQKFTVFLCENPWPALGVFPYTDSAMNFSTMYCRDNKPNLLPDLGSGAVLTPPLSYVPSNLAAEVTGLPGVTRLQVTMATLDKAQVLKEFLFPVQNSKDVIGIRVMQNPDWLSPLAWYKKQDFIGNPQPLSDTIDGYAAIQDGTTVYLAAPNVINADDPASRQIFSNIYLISYNPDATAETKNIRDQMVKNFKLNVNVDSDANVCKLNTNTSCLFDANCPVGDKCSVQRSKLARDTQRVQDLLYISQLLENYKNKPGGTYPRLEAGSYLRGLTNSKWPSWSAILGNNLGAGLPDDPLGQAVGLNKCKPPNFEGYVKETCWNAQALEFSCPAGSQIYQYRSKGPLDFELSANFEYEPLLFKWQNWVPSPNGIIPAGATFISDFCAAPINYNGNGFCGDGKVGSYKDTNGNWIVEECDRGQLRWAPCTPDNGAVDSGLIRQVCKDNCSGWQDTSESKCAPNLFCGNGKKDAGEACDDGVMNGQYGKCNADCSGKGDSCGDGILSAPEKCDRQTYNFTAGWSTPGTASTPSAACDNGVYGCCRLDCSGPGPSCGDGKPAPGIEDCENGQTKSAAGYCVDNNKPCDTQIDCNAGASCVPACQIQTKYYCSKDREQPCSISNGNNDCLPNKGDCKEYKSVTDWTCSACQWTPATASSCHAEKAPICGNGSPDSGEQCDDGNINNNDGCTNDCQKNICGDGIVFSAKICLSGDKKLGESCEKDADCGQGGQCAAPEACDMGKAANGGKNGVACSAAYGATCSYCSQDCKKAFVQGPYCGDKILQSNPATPGRPEVCDWAAGTNQLQRQDFQFKEQFDPAYSVCADNCQSMCPPDYGKGVLRFGSGDDKTLSYKFTPGDEQPVTLPDDCRLAGNQNGLQSNLRLNVRFSRSKTLANGGDGIKIILASDAGANVQAAHDAAQVLVTSLCAKYPKLEIGLVFEQRGYVTNPNSSWNWNIDNNYSCANNGAALSPIIAQIEAGPSGSGNDQYVATIDNLRGVEKLLNKADYQKNFVILLSDGDSKDYRIIDGTIVNDANNAFRDLLAYHNIQTVIVNINESNTGDGDCGPSDNISCAHQMEQVWAQDNSSSPDSRPLIWYVDARNQIQNIDTLIDNLVSKVTVRIQSSAGVREELVDASGEVAIGDAPKDLINCPQTNASAAKMSVLFVGSLFDNRNVEISGSGDYCQGPPFSCTITDPSHPEGDCPAGHGYICKDSRCQPETPLPLSANQIYCGGKTYNVSADNCVKCVNDAPIKQDCTAMDGHSGALTCQDGDCVCDANQRYSKNGTSPSASSLGCSADNKTYTYFDQKPIYDANLHYYLFTCARTASTTCNYGCTPSGCRQDPCIATCSGKCGNYNGCSCGSCPSGYDCQINQCVAACVSETNWCNTSTECCSGLVCLKEPTGLPYLTCQQPQSQCPSDELKEGGGCSPENKEVCLNTTTLISCQKIPLTGCLVWETEKYCNQSGQRCSGGKCVSTCAPSTCSSLGRQCGSWSNNCGGTLSCGNCSGINQSCNSSGQCVCSPNYQCTANVCAGGNYYYQCTNGCLNTSMNQCPSGQYCQTQMGQPQNGPGQCCPIVAAGNTAGSGCTLGANPICDSQTGKKLVCNFDSNGKCGVWMVLDCLSGTCHSGACY